MTLFRLPSVLGRIVAPATVAWVVLAIAVTGIEGSRDSHQWVPIAVLGLLGCFGIVGGLLMFAHPVVGPFLVMTGFIVTSFAISLATRLPIDHQFGRESETFDIGWASSLRSSLTELARALPGVGNQLVPGLAVGDTSLLTDSLDSDMKTVSLTHLVAVSGANCAVLTAGVVAVVSALGGTRWVRVVAASLTLSAFVAVVGPQPSVIRASVMAIILLIAFAYGNPAAGLPVLAIAATLLLVVNPLWAIELGFTLSVLATSALLILAPPLADRMSRWMPRGMAIVIAVPLAAELVCQPVIVSIAPGLPTYGILANVLATPAAPIATVAGILAAITIPLSPLVGSVFLWVCWLPASWIAFIAQAAAQLPFARLMWLPGIAGVALSCTLSAAVVLALLGSRARQRAVGLAVISLTLVVSLVSTVVIHTWRQIGRPNDWLIAACDVGQGDALLVRPRAGSSDVMLIDTGRDENLLRACLSNLGVGKIALLVLTHYDIDHCGAYAVVEDRVERALVGRPVDESELAIVDDLRESGAQIDFGRVGLNGNLGDAGFRWRELWPTPGHPDMQSGNPGSLVIRVDWARQSPTDPPLSAVFLGDLGEQAQRALLASTALRPATVVKVAHHGSADQSDSLYAHLDARIGLVSVGADNGYGHPTDRALDILSSHGTSAHRTDEQGMLLVRRSGGRIEVWSER